MNVCHSLFARGRKEAHHLHGQLKPLKVMLQVFSFDCEAVLQKKKKAANGCYQAYSSCYDIPAWKQKELMTGHYEV